MFLLGLLSVQENLQLLSYIYSFFFPYTFQFLLGLLSVQENLWLFSYTLGFLIVQENLQLLSYTFLLFSLYIPICTGSSQRAGKSKVALIRQSNFQEWTHTSHFFKQQTRR